MLSTKLLGLEANNFIDTRVQEIPQWFKHLLWCLGVCGLNSTNPLPKYPPKKIRIKIIIFYTDIVYWKIPQVWASKILEFVQRWIFLALLAPQRDQKLAAPRNCTHYMSFIPWNIPVNVTACNVLLWTLYQYCRGRTAASNHYGMTIMGFEFLVSCYFVNTKSSCAVPKFYLQPRNPLDMVQNDLAL